MPFLGRRACPHCKKPTWAVKASHWEDEQGSGMLEELRCSGCDATLFREKGTALMTRDEHLAWRAARGLPKATLRR